MSRRDASTTSAHDLTGLAGIEAEDDVRDNTGASVRFAGVPGSDNVSDGRNANV